MSVARAASSETRRSGRPSGRWICYLIACSDGTLYTGITTSLDRRLALHNRGRASKYTRGRLPVRLVYAERHPTRSSASRREAQIKRMSRAGKRALAPPSGGGVCAHEAGATTAAARRN